MTKKIWDNFLITIILGFVLSVILMFWYILILAGVESYYYSVCNEHNHVRAYINPITWDVYCTTRIEGTDIVTPIGDLE